MPKKIDVSGLDHYHDKVSAMVADEYSSSATYAVGDYCFHAGTLYECTTAITTAEAWTAGHWTAAKLAEDTSALKTALISKFVLESGTFQDANGTTKTTKTSRIRNKSIMVVTNCLNMISIPTGYQMWIYYLDENKTLLGNSNWVSGEFDLSVKKLPKTRYINFAIKNISTPNSDISSEIPTVQASLLFYESALNQYLPTWNVAAGGVEVNGKQLIFHANGMGLSSPKGSYYVAPTNDEDIVITTTRAKNALLCIDTTKLGAINTRTLPTTCVVEIGGSDVLPNSYIPIAYYYDSSEPLRFVGNCLYFQDYYSDLKQKKLHGVPIAHQFSENHYIAHQKDTIADITTAISAGYKIIEFDVVFTSDNIPVLSHDLTFTVDGTTYTIANETYSDLVAVKSDLAKLEDALVLCKKNNVSCDIDYTKLTYSTAQNAVSYELINSLGMNGRVFITAYLSTATEFSNMANPLCICVSSSNSTSAIDALADIAKKALVCIASIGSSYATQALISYAHSLKILTKVWTIDSEATATTLFGYGTDFIITNTLTT